MDNILIIGAGGVGRVVAHKVASAPDVFRQVTLASRTREKCDAIAAELPRPIQTAALDADDSEAVARLIRETGAGLVLNVALPYQDLAIMDGCLMAGAHYIDTANYEPREVAKFEYSWQWAYADRFRQAGLMALLGSGFDPGVTNVFTAWLAKHELDTIEELNIVDANAGSHGMAFATNFNPEINIREVTAPCRHWQNGEWVETPALSEKRVFDFPEGIGPMNIYRMYHEELESLVKHFPSLNRAQFWMTFSDNYLRHLEVLQNVGMTRIDPVRYAGIDIIPLQFLKAVLPDPASLGPLTSGQTCIGCVADGVKNAQPARRYIYNICDHEACYRETNSQAISYTTGVPAMVGALMVATGQWSGAGVFNMEQLDPDPFLEALAKYGLPWKVIDPGESNRL
ncbi:MAG: saccharopine dehydrogenase C-terminal domain-containing protein [Puniceicoccaceae bacterium]